MDLLVVTGPRQEKPNNEFGINSGFAMQVLELGAVQLAYEYTPRNASTTCLMGAHTAPRTLPPQC